MYLQNWTFSGAAEMKASDCDKTGVDSDMLQEGSQPFRKSDRNDPWAEKEVPPGQKRCEVSAFG